MSSETGPEETGSTEPKTTGDITEAQVYCNQCGKWVRFDLRGPVACPEHGEGERP